MNIEDLPQHQKLITKPNLCRAFDMTRSGIDKMGRTDPTFPKPIKFSDSRQAQCYFVVEEVTAWLEAQKAKREAA